MNSVRFIFFVFLIVLYSSIFSYQDGKMLEKPAYLEAALPASFHKIAAGYLKQLAAELLFVQNSVFLGNVRPGTPPTSYEVALGNNFEVMTQIYPQFIDPYYFCQGFLTNISSTAAAKASKIFETGIAAYPNDIILHFFYGFNLFMFMDEPLKGAKAFERAAKIPTAPPMFGHLAALLSAKGGDIAAGLISLRTLLDGEKNEAVRKRYEEEIVIFEHAMEVQKAIKAYTESYGSPPKTLDQLVPDFLKQLPEIGNSLVLIYDPPNLHLQRPQQKKKHQVVD